LNKNFFYFLIIFSLILILGCIGGGQQQATSNETSGQFSKGTFSAKVIVNGQNTNMMTLLSQQSAQIGLQIQNVGGSDLKNVKAILVGCAEGVVHKDKANITAGGQDFFSWTVTAPSLSQSEIINCPTTIRVCYDRISRGYTELKFIPEDYLDTPEPPNSYSDSDVLATTFNIGVTRVLKNGPNDFSGAITISNIGPGWVDYVTYTEGLSINTLRKLTINISSPNVAITKLRDEPGNYGSTFVLDAATAGSKISLLKLVQGNELYLPIRLNVTNANPYQSAPITETLNVEIDHGYCLDLATIQVTLRGR
jgi:hypothetical protein